MTNQIGPRYQAIARKYRPQTFGEVVAQGAIVQTLKNALRFEQVAHAYLFCGSRGVGKTTLARLFAKALNCSALTAEFEPCNTCASCREILSGQSLDVMEIDGASNRGIDDIRQINETVGYAPAQGKYKIYIIDEVHMLTKEAFNALLKTLEEPPARAKFFFATTEAQKVLPTIVSRCQRFDLGRILPQQIADKLQEIATDLGRQVAPDALHLIASFAEGSLRDAESILDQLFCFTQGTLTAAVVRQALGLVSEELFFSLDQAFAEARLPRAFELVQTLFEMGKDLGHFLEQLIEHYRNLTLYKTVGEKALPPEVAERYAPVAQHYTQGQCLHILQMLIEAEGPFQKSVFQRVALESLLLRVIRSKNRIPVEVLVRRLSQLEETLKGEVVVAAPSKVERVEEVMAPPKEVVPEVVKPIVVEKVPEEVKPVMVAPPKEVVPEVVKPIVAAPQVTGKHPSHYDTLMRFAAIELEGSLKIN